MKKKDSLLVRAAWKIRNLLPEHLECRCIRMYRRILQFMGYPFSGRRPGVVVMLHIGRCGSTVLANMLDQNPDIYWDGKTARKAAEIYGRAVKELNVSAWFRQQFFISGSRYYGFEFKMLRDQYVTIFEKTVPELLEIFKSIGVSHYILLYRSNTLNQAISHYSGLNSRVWHVSPDSPEQGSSKSFTVDFDHVTTGSGEGMPLLDYIRDIEATKKDIRNILQGYSLLELEYERDILEAGPMSAYQKICDFLNIPPGEVFVKNKKVLSLKPCEAVANYQDALDALDGTEFEWMLDR